MSNQLDRETVDEVCLLGQGKACCRYLVFGSGFECAKHTDLKGYLDLRVANGTMNARGDNCEGVK